MPQKLSTEERREMVRLEVLGDAIWRAAVAIRMQRIKDWPTTHSDKWNSNRRMMKFVADLGLIIERRDRKRDDIGAVFERNVALIYLRDGMPAVEDLVKTLCVD